VGSFFGGGKWGNGSGNQHVSFGGQVVGFANLCIIDVRGQIPNVASPTCSSPQVWSLMEKVHVNPVDGVWETFLPPLLESRTCDILEFHMPIWSQRAINSIYFIGKAELGMDYMG